MGIEDPDADVADQLRPAVQRDDEVEDDAQDVELHTARISVPLEADPADVADQHTVVPLEDEDEVG